MRLGFDGFPLFGSSALLFLTMKRLLTQTIDNELVTVLSLDAIGYSPVMNYLRERQLPDTLRETPDEPLHGIDWDFP
jgi:hypothetical protein